MVALDAVSHSDELTSSVVSKVNYQNRCCESYSWQLVWCHERCHKRECDERRAAIKEAAREAGGMLVCIKKANKFAMWLAEAQRQPFVLLTDWREVKPCTEAIADVRPQGRTGPSLTVVLAEEPRQFERASAWAQGFPPHVDPVHVCQDLGPPRAFIAKLANSLRSRAATTALRSSATPWGAEQCPGETALQSSATPWVPNSVPERRFLPLKALARYENEPDEHGCGTGLMRAAQHQLWKTTPLHQARKLEAPTIATAFMAVGADTRASLVAQVLSPVYASGHTPVQIEQLLREAMPDHYDD